MSEVDPYSTFSSAYTIVSQTKDAENFDIIAIDVDGYKVNVKNQDATDIQEVYDTCARTAQEVRQNRT